MTRIVVGIDGSPGAATALAHAAEEARLRNAVLEVVHITAPPPATSPFVHGLSAEVMSADMYADMVRIDREHHDELEEQTRQQGERVLTDATEGITEDVKVETTLLFDRRPARRLVDLVAERGDTTLLVVGSRGRGELSGLLLGSVSQACVTHAPVPVTVVPDRR